MLQIRKEQIQSLRQNINLTFRQDVLDILKENDYETIEDPNTNDIGIKDKRGNTSWLRYNQDAQPNIFELPSGTAYNLNYYEDGALQSIKMPNGNAIELFTQDGKLLNLKHKGGSSLSLKYNKDNKISDVLISNKKKFQFKYDEQYGYFNALVDGNKETKHFNHDNSGNLRQKIDAESRTTYFHYEVGENDLKEIHYPDGSRETYRYDEEENYLEITQRNNSLVKNFYDDDDNLRQVEWQDGSYILIEKDEKDDIGSIQNENVLINLKKDDKNRIIEEESDFASIKYEYDVEDQLSKLTYADNYELSYEYDVDGELSAIKDSEGNKHLLSHDAKASTNQIIFQGGNAVYTIREHFNGQIAETNINTNSGHSFGQIYDYDNQERLSKINDSRSKFPTRYISYDDADHLLAIKDDKEKIIEKFEYDKSGQMITANNNTIVIGNMEEIKFYGEKQLTYDANGNLANFNGIKAVYKNNGVLAEIEANGQKWNYEYDPFGRRIKKTNGRESYQYIWTGLQLLEEIHTSTNGTQTKQKYLYRPFEQIPFAIKDEKGLYLLQQDHRGAIIRAVDTFGELVWEAEYDAFGKAYPRTEKINQPWRLQGQYFDKESELHYNVGRYYCPKLKTYLSRDPQWHEVQASNYNYANNDPYNKADSLGCFWEEVGNGLAKVGNAVVNTTTKVKDYVVDTTTKVKDYVVETANKVENAVVDSAIATKDYVVETTNKVGNAVVDSAIATKGYVVETANKVENAVVDSAIATKDYVVETANKVENAVVDSAIATKDYVVETANKVENAVVDASITAKDYVVDTAIKVGNAIKRTWEYTKNVVVNNVTSGINWLKKTYVKVKNKIVTALVEAATFVKNVVLATGEAIVCFLKQRVSNAVHIVKGLWNSRKSQEFKAVPNSKTLGDKEKRYDKRIKLISDAKKNANNLPPAERDKVLKAAERLERNNKAVERARLVDHIYTEPFGNKKKLGSSPPTGWKYAKIEGENQCLTNPYKDPKTGFVYGVYESEFENPPKKVLVFRGTDNKDEFFKDWGTNFGQGPGLEMGQYTQSIEMAREMKNLYGDDVEIAGHSKAGGQAAAAGIVTDTKTYSFNAAPVNSATIKRATNGTKSLDDGIGKDKNGENKVDAYNYDYDPLSNAADNLVVSTAAGTRHVLEPKDEDGNPVDYSFRNIADFHDMPATINSIEYEKNTDSQILKNSLQTK